MIEPQVTEIAALNKRQTSALRCFEPLFGLILRLLELQWTGQPQSAPLRTQ
jgi:hypothetical protein